MEYQTVQEPAAIDSGTKNDEYAPRLLAWSGRIGRVRYLAYSSAAVIAVLLVAGLSGGLLGVAGLGNTSLLGLVQGIVGIAMVVASFVIARRRFNDMGRSGWWSVLLAVPLVNMVATLWLVFGKGDSGPNAFGPRPVPNTRGVIIVACLVPVLLFGAVVAGAMKGYQAGGGDYRVRPPSGSQTF